MNIINITRGVTRDPSNHPAYRPAKNIVYLIECTKCRVQYVGESETALHIHMNGHRSDIKHCRLEKPVAKHFNLPGHSIDELTILVIEKIYRDNASFRRLKESLWIQTLWTLAPNGLNHNP